MKNTELKNIVDCAVNGNDFPFNRFFEDTFKTLHKKLVFLTNCEDDAKEVFIISMHKFWERFVINQEELPHNSIGYIYMMCRNAWLLQKRQLKNTVALSENHDTVRHDTCQSDLNMETDAIDNENLLKHKALIMAIETLSPKCKTLIEAELDNQIKLKDLQNDLGYNNYQALVQAKYNCKKKLIKKVYEILINLKKNITISK